jgi:tRNA U34 2-thiouridine synthase MnmA/TrmU
MAERFFGSPIPNPQAVALFSRGLDSILAVKILQQQHLAIQGVFFTTPFFNTGIRGQENEFIAKIAKDYGIPLCVIDISTEFLELLAAPAHGYGKNFNPCIDCKLLMVRGAKTYAAKWGASFIVTGEVLGQRPFSQRRDTMRIIERDSETTGMLLRPLSAKLLTETIPEQEGLVDRTKLFDFSGRGRKPQLRLAAELGITNFPTPAGGCLLTDPAYARRIKTLYADEQRPDARGVEMLKYGRFYHFPPAGFLVVGRNQSENQQLLQLADRETIIMRLGEMPGPIGILSGSAEQLPAASSLLINHSKARNNPDVLISWKQGDRSGSFRQTGVHQGTDFS